MEGAAPAATKAPGAKAAAAGSKPKSKAAPPAAKAAAPAPVPAASGGGGDVDALTAAVTKAQALVKQLKKDAAAPEALESAAAALTAVRAKLSAAQANQTPGDTFPRKGRTPTLTHAHREKWCRRKERPRNEGSGWIWRAKTDAVNLQAARRRWAMTLSGTTLPSAEANGIM